jgi:hypothetical protein
LEQVKTGLLAQPLRTTVRAVQYCPFLGTPFELFAGPTIG